MSRQIEGLVTGIILGGLAGAAIGILFAPQSGRKTRRDINNTAEELLTKAREEYETALKKSVKACESAVKQLRRLESSAREQIGDIGEKAGDLADLGKEAFHDTTGHLSKAVNAAVHAFK
jgi:gas vesicle protein